MGLSTLSLQAENLDLELNSIFNENTSQQATRIATEKSQLVKQGDTKGKTETWTLNRLAKKITREKYPLLALYQIWQNGVSTEVKTENSLMAANSPLDYLNFHVKCSSEQFTEQFVKLCHLLGIDSRKANVEGKTVYDFCFEKDDWSYLDLSQGQFYLGWDNTTLVSSENLMDDPLLMLRSKMSRNEPLNLTDNWLALARLKIINFEMQESALFNLESEKINIQDFISRNYNIPSTGQVVTHSSNISNKEEQAVISITNETGNFEYSSPFFRLTSSKNCPVEKIQWQISLDKKFKVIPFNLEGTQTFSSTFSLSLLDETFLNANQTYYLRVKGSNEKEWSNWSRPFEFSVKKPESVTLVEFEQVDKSQYELNWEREAEASEELIEYLIFGSNAFDFIPSIYAPTQINEIVDGEVVGEEVNENLVAITTDTKLIVDGSLAYYRIIARKQGQLSVPSPIIHVYGSDLIQPRTIMQIEEANEKLVAKRILFPSSYPWTETALPRLGVMNRLYDNSILELHTYITNTMAAKEDEAVPVVSYVKPSHLPKSLWNKMKPYFLPENHPWKSKIDRIFSASRASKNSAALMKAGFKGRVTRVRKIFAGTHPSCEDCFFKIYTDSEVTSRYTEWQKWLDRIRGKDNVFRVIKNRGFQKWFSVPDKWCYPLPETPAAPARSTRYKPKDFILVASNQKPYDHYENEKLWRTKITSEMLDALYIVLDEAGMWDSMFIFNIPFSKIDGKICFVDTEYSHKWPLRYEKLSKYLSSNDRKYWEYLIKHHGPKGYKRNTPR